MSLTLTIITILFLIITVRLLFRKVLDLPNYKGKLLTATVTITDFMPEDEFWKIIHKTNSKAKRHYQHYQPRKSFVSTEH
jgi:hypothetical protein